MKVNNLRRFRRVKLLASSHVVFLIVSIFQIRGMSARSHRQHHEETGRSQAQPAYRDWLDFMR